MTADRLLDAVVASFDSASGLGRLDVDGRAFEFHCVEIADGTREIDVGAAVRFRPMRKFGLVEAAQIRPRPG